MKPLPAPLLLEHFLAPCPRACAHRQRRRALPPAPPLAPPHCGQPLFPRPLTPRGVTAHAPRVPPSRSLLRSRGRGREQRCLPRLPLAAGRAGAGARASPCPGGRCRCAAGRGLPPPLPLTHTGRRRGASPCGTLVAVSDRWRQLATVGRRRGGSPAAPSQPWAPRGAPRPGGARLGQPRPGGRPLPGSGFGSGWGAAGRGPQEGGANAGPAGCGVLRDLENKPRFWGSCPLAAGAR